MSNETPGQVEATGEENAFDFFGKTWHLPPAVRLSHQRALQQNPSNVGLVDTFLPPAEVKALNVLDPTADEIDAFTDVIVARLGLKNSGNS